MHDDSAAHASHDPQVAMRIRKARRTAKIVGAVAVGIFLLSILQVMWLRYDDYRPPPPSQAASSGNG